VATVGKLQIPQAASNVIPGEVVCSLDLRSAEEAVLWRAYEQIGALSEAIGRRRGIRIERKRVQTSLPVAMLFVRCYQGISHHPLEDVAEGDLMAAIPICDKFIQQLTEIWRYPP
jgi:allantoate deiminase